MIQNSKADTIYPVIVPVPQKKRHLKGSARNACLSRYARHALEISGKETGVQVEIANLPKDRTTGAPLPVKGNYWSLTHKPEYAGGVVSPGRIGMDIEKIQPRSPCLFGKVADQDEWALMAEEDPLMAFFRFWTAKEAVLKATGVGLRELSECKATKIIDDQQLLICHRNKEWAVVHFRFDGHIASVAKEGLNVKWLFKNNYFGEN